MKDKLSQGQAAISVSFPRKTLMFVAIFTLFVQLWSVIFVFSANRSGEHFLQYDLPIQDIRNKIVYLDEVLTMSAYMAAFSDDPSWRLRHSKAAQRLEEVLATAQELAPTAAQKLSTKQVAQANIELLKIEAEVFDHVAMKEMKKAQALLKSEAYLSSKKAYENGITEFGSALHSKTEQRIKTQKRSAAVSVVIMILVLLITVTLWSRLYGLLARWNNRLNTTVKELGKSEKQLKSQTILLESIIDNLPISVFAKDVQNDYRWVLWNKKSEHTFGLSTEQIIGKTDYDYFPKDEADHFRRTDEKVIENKVVFDIPEEKVTTAHGARIAHTIKVPIFDEEGEAILLLGILEDITERVNAQKKMEHANQLKSSFLANMSHELRTPMHAIIGFSRQGIQHADSWSLRENIENLNFINKSGKRLLELINDLLDLSKMEADAVEYDMQEHDITKVVESTFKEMSVLADEKRISIEVRNVCHPLNAKIDVLKISQIMINLLSNAIKFSPKDSLICISCKKELKNNAQWARIEVCDQGPGIPDDELNSIFDKFTQSSHNKNYVGGTGLGLAICKEIVLAHKGKIFAENIGGEGARFSVFLPLLVQESQEEGCNEK